MSRRSTRSTATTAPSSAARRTLESPHQSMRNSLQQGAGQGPQFLYDTEQVQARIAEVKQAVNEDKQQLQQLNERFKRFVLRKAEIDTNDKGWRQRYEDLFSETQEHLNDARDESVRQITAIARTNQDLVDQITHLHSQLDKTTMQFNLLNSGYNSLQSQLDSTRRELNANRSQLADIVQQRDALLEDASTSTVSGFKLGFNGTSPADLVAQVTQQQDELDNLNALLQQYRAGDGARGGEVEKWKNTVRVMERETSILRELVTSYEELLFQNNLINTFSKYNLNNVDQSDGEGKSASKGKKSRSSKKKRDSDDELAQDSSPGSSEDEDEDGDMTDRTPAKKKGPKGHRDKINAAVRKSIQAQSDNHKTSSAQPNYGQEHDQDHTSGDISSSDYDKNASDLDSTDEEAYGSDDPTAPKRPKRTKKDSKSRSSRRMGDDSGNDEEGEKPSKKAKKAPRTKQLSPEEIRDERVRVETEQRINGEYDLVIAALVKKHDQQVSTMQKQNLQAQQAQLKLHKAEMQEVHQYLKEAQKDLLDQKTDNLALRSENHKLLADLNSLEAQFQTLQAQSDSLEKRYEQLEKQFEQISEQYQEKLNEIEQLQDAKNSLQKGLQRYERLLEREEMRLGLVNSIYTIDRDLVLGNNNQSDEEGQKGQNDRFMTADDIPRFDQYLEHMNTSLGIAPYYGTGREDDGREQDLAVHQAFVMDIRAVVEEELQKVDENASLNGIIASNFAQQMSQMAEQRQKELQEEVRLEQLRLQQKQLENEEKEAKNAKKLKKANSANTESTQSSPLSGSWFGSFFGLFGSGKSNEDKTGGDGGHGGHGGDDEADGEFESGRKRKRGQNSHNDPKMTKNAQKLDQLGQSQAEVQARIKKEKEAIRALEDEEAEWANERKNREKKILKLQEDLVNLDSELNNQALEHDLLEQSIADRKRELALKSEAGKKELERELEETELELAQAKQDAQDHYAALFKQHQDELAQLVSSQQEPAGTKGSKMSNFAHESLFDDLSDNIEEVQSDDDDFIPEEMLREALANRAKNSTTTTTTTTTVDKKIKPQTKKHTMGDSEEEDEDDEDQDDVQDEDDVEDEDQEDLFSDEEEDVDDEDEDDEGRAENPFASINLADGQKPSRLRRRNQPQQDKNSWYTDEDGQTNPNSTPSKSSTPGRSTAIITSATDHLGQYIQILNSSRNPINLHNWSLFTHGRQFRFIFPEGAVIPARGKFTLRTLSSQDVENTFEPDDDNNVTVYVRHALWAEEDDKCTIYNDEGKEKASVRILSEVNAFPDIAQPVGCSLM